MNKSELDKIKTVQEGKALLMKFRTESQDSRLRKLEIKDQIEALREELKGLDGSWGPQLREDEILKKIGELAIASP